MSTYEEKNTWVITGVEKLFRSMAKDMAKKENLTIGEYIECLISTHHDETQRVNMLENKLMGIEGKLMELSKILSDIFEKDYISQPRQTGWFWKKKA